MTASCYAQTSKVDSAAVFPKKKAEKRKASFFTFNFILEDTEYPPTTRTTLQQVFMDFGAVFHPQTITFNFDRYMNESITIPIRNYALFSLQNGGLAFPIGR